VAITAGPLALVGGDEFHPGNEVQDALLCEAAAGRPAYIVATAARDSPEAAVATAQRWFRRFDVDITELRVRTITEARSTATAELARGAGLIYICGGDPGRVVQVLRGTLVWEAIRQSWRDGCALGGSSAGAMALCEWSLVRRGFPGHTDRRGLEGLNLVPASAFLPHYDTFGERWIPSAQESVGADTLLIGVDERSAAVWIDGAWSAMGPGRVVLVRGDERTVFPALSPIEGLPQPDAG
jgi:cyanophycinase